MKIYVKGNFFIYEDSSNQVWVDNRESILVYKANNTSTDYNILLKGTSARFVGIPFSSINDEAGSPYASQSVFETYIYENTGVVISSTGGGATNLSYNASPTYGEVVSDTGSNAIIPLADGTNAGLMTAVEKTKLSGIAPNATANDGDMTKAVYDADNDGVVDSAERLEFIGRNSTGSTIAKTKVVYISGATGQRPNITLADASSGITSSNTIGVTRDSIANNSNGYIITHGVIHSIDTSAFADGDALWLSETAGEITATPPAEPAYSVFIGYVAYAHAVNGKIILHIQNGYELDELHGVKMTSDANDDVLQKKAGLWVNRTLAQLWTDLKDLTVTLTNKTLNLTSNTLTGTKAEFDTACTDGDSAYQSDISGFSSSGNVLAITELSNSTMVSHTVPTGANFTVINLNSDATNRYAKITFTAPDGGKVLLSMLFDMIVSSSSAVQMIGIHSSSSSTTTPDGGWYRINADNDASSGQFYAEFILTGLTPSSSYTYYFMGVCNYSNNKIRASSQQTGAYSSGSDLPIPLRITATDLGSLSITSNPTS